MVTSLTCELIITESFNVLFLWDMLNSDHKKRVGVDNLHLWGDGRSQRPQLNTNFKSVERSLLNRQF